MKTLGLLLLTLSVACVAQLTSRNYNKDTLAPSVREQALQEQVNLLMERLNRVESELKEIREDKTSQSQATFYARGLRSGYDSNAYRKGDRLIYQTPLINPGGHYNKNTGEYTCPTSGVYMFVYSVYGLGIKQGFSHSCATASLYREGEVVSEVGYANDNNEDTFLSLSHTDVVSCEAGQRVWIQGDWDKNFIWSNNIALNVFGGVLLYST